MPATRAQYLDVDGDSRIGEVSARRGAVSRSKASQAAVAVVGSCCTCALTRPRTYYRPRRCEDLRGDFPSPALPGSGCWGSLVQLLSFSRIPYWVPGPAPPLTSQVTFNPPPRCRGYVRPQVPGWGDFGPPAPEGPGGNWRTGTGASTSARISPDEHAGITADDGGWRAAPDAVRSVRSRTTVSSAAARSPLGGIASPRLQATGRGGRWLSSRR